jgi:hypothetical protein
MVVAHVHVISKKNYFKIKIVKARNKKSRDTMNMMRLLAPHETQKEENQDEVSKADLILEKVVSMGRLRTNQKSLQNSWVYKIVDFN